MKKIFPLTFLAFTFVSSIAYGKDDSNLLPDIPNYVEKNKVGSSAIANFVFSCSDEAQKTGLNEFYSIRYCSCVSDYHTSKFNKFKPNEVRKTPKKILNFCASSKVLEDDRAMMAPNFFDSKRLSSLAIIVGQLGCLEELGTVPLCSCITDAIRLLYFQVGRDNISQEKSLDFTNKKCSNIKEQK